MAIIDDGQWHGFFDVAPGNMLRQFSGAVVSPSLATQNFAVGVPGDIEWATVSYDVGGWFDAGDDPTIFTIPAGVSMVRTFFNVRVDGAFSVTDALRVQFRQNAAVNLSIGGAAMQMSTGLEPRWAVTSPVFLVAAGDKISVQVDSTDTLVVVRDFGTIFGIEGVVC